MIRSVVLFSIIITIIVNININGVAAQGVGSCHMNAELYDRCYEMVQAIEACESTKCAVCAYPDTQATIDQGKSIYLYFQGKEYYSYYDYHLKIVEACSSMYEQYQCFGAYVSSPGGLNHGTDMYIQPATVYYINLEMKGNGNCDFRSQGNANKTGMWIGIGVGGGVGVLLMIGLVVCIRRRRSDKVGSPLVPVVALKTTVSETVV